MKIYYIKCPDCKNSFHCDSGLYGQDLPRHCPRCDAYFDPQEKKAHGPLSGTAFGGLSQPIREAIYLPNRKL